MYYKFSSTVWPQLFFVAKAVSKNNKHKPIMNNILSTGTKVVATDGHRLHIFAHDGKIDLPAGLYEIKKKTKTVLELLLVDEAMNDYPGYQHISDGKVGEIAFPTRWNGNQLEIVGKYTEVVRAMENGTINYNYFEDANLVEMNYYAAGDYKAPVVLTGDRVTAIIMPVDYIDARLY